MRWTEEEDQMIATMVLTSMEKGITLNGVFLHLSEKLGRTEKACRFRWYRELRPRYEASIELTKQQRRKKKPTPVKKKRFQPSFSSLDLDSLGTYLKEQQALYTKTFQENQQLKERIREKEELLEEVRKRMQEKEEENQRLKSEMLVMRKRIEGLGIKEEIIEDYQTMLEILTRARELALKEEIIKSPGSFTEAKDEKKSGQA